LALDVGLRQPDAIRAGLVRRPEPTGGIISAQLMDPKFAGNVRPSKCRGWCAHTGEIENQPHWVLDVSWGEDAQQTSNQAAAKNLACVRKFTLNLWRAWSNSGD
ncbi:MAG: hypothetical protein VB137_09270, partial [Burkholderia sp.]